MNIMDKALALDLSLFEEENKKILLQESTDSDLFSVSEKALALARRNIEVISNYVGEQVRRVGLTFEGGGVKYNYSSPEDVSSAFKTALTRAIDPGIARNSAVIAVNLMLGSFGRPSAFPTEDEHTAATIALAFSINKHREDVIQGTRFFLESLNQHRENRYRRRKNQIMIFGIFLLLFFVWFVASR